ncbi:hypothetical protein L228DRAFT_242618 [Xylona heveae TC161]|uniref:Alpha/beta-hydrolase n=1 Tax=Xylona heveae (strain CBS 132557 / TC161) TaxID=1328760 RepID=A0A165JG47_XYLHT|nr:hypothetical protein L228DRAFT_242618 [Xylona heveae TC161]KZF26191.1 hypothetical protein L228DRAFT_242618 [Xylona heveae TC161]
MVLSAPTFSFKIPSIHDSTLLDCRIYHPQKSYHTINPESRKPASFGHGGDDESATADRDGILRRVRLDENDQSGSSRYGSGIGIWAKRGAVIAHPYAPLGGSYDDPAVHLLASEALRAGFVVGTFNFRGAGASEGSTSWTAKPELADYISFTGFLMQYLLNIWLAEPSGWIGHDKVAPAIEPFGPSEFTTTAAADCSNAMMLLLSGYSYGSMITSRLPETDEIFARFESVRTGSPEAEIKLRGQSLAKEWNKGILRSSVHAAPDRSSGTMPLMTMGWDESENHARNRKTSHEVRRSLDTVRKSVDHMKTKYSHRPHASVQQAFPVEDPHTQVPSQTPRFLTFYLLVSPLLSPVSLLATLFSRQMNWGSQEESDERLSRHDTLAIYGDEDMFTSGKKLRRWAQRLSERPQSRFRFQEIAGAGHFWHDPRAARELRLSAKSWFDEILS